MENLSDRKIFIVDDAAANIDILVDALEDDYDLSVAMDGESALEAVQEDKPDLILLDIMMPGIDGFETCRQLKAKNITWDIPVIFFSAKNEPEDIVKGFSVGGVDYITKPFSQEEVRARVKTHLHLQMLKSELKSKNR